MTLAATPAGRMDRLGGVGDNRAILPSRNTGGAFPALRASGSCQVPTSLLILIVRAAASAV
jgi:hypothetical protein